MNTDDDIQIDEYPLIETENGWRCPGIGEMFQAKCRTPEWKAALTVFDKYRRKLNLEHKHLIELRGHIVAFSDQRKTAGKQASKEFLTQEASAYCLQNWKL